MLRAILQRGLVTLLTHTRLLEHINMLIEQTVLFAKNVPYFMNIHEPDRIALLKTCVFDVICVRHSIFFRPGTTTKSIHSSLNDHHNHQSSKVHNDDLATLAACAVAASSNCGQQQQQQQQQQMPVPLQPRIFIPLWNTWLNQDMLIQSLPQLAQFITMLFDFYAFLSSIQPSEYELSIFASYLLFNTGKKRERGIISSII